MYRRLMGLSKWYFIALHEHHIIFRKAPGAKISHYLKQAYYKCLLRLPPGVRLNQALALADADERPKDAEFTKLMVVGEDIKLDPEYAPLNDGSDSDSSDGSSHGHGSGDDVIHDFVYDSGLEDSDGDPTPKRVYKALCFELLPPPEDIKDRVEFLFNLDDLGIDPTLVKAQALVNEKQICVTVLWDNSRKQRCYTPCVRNDHGRCCKWRLVHLATSYKDLTTWACAWALRGVRTPAMQRPDHKRDAEFVDDIPTIARFMNFD